MLPLAVKLPLLLKFPPIEWFSVPVEKVVPEPIEKSPATVKVFKAVAAAVPEMVKSPVTVNAVTGIVFVPLPLKIRL